MLESEKRVIDSMREQAELWSGLLPHDAVAAHQAAVVVETWKSLVPLRGQLSFDEQPADFDAALLAGKRGEDGHLGK
ncbi:MULTISPECIES: hypothetical protein [Agrobacterium]|uniref:Uncharacterized protein n=1 Tax=Agrobacterium rubi TaxID=28099 RepID=A0AAE7R8U4_9HYPH|nr:MULTISPECIES: hypothetical protein [Agrobacterium]MBN7809217.1 hypothetical protein [Agrobacterium rosae]NTE89841.1 hypothetical protein [Agrobacterium rubi]NTF05309.1 hypothetical protein [Agrobacterium rubi]NTF39753.1 hypothetical protein [Agrobacterium rubi]QTG03404.1 hypothetical protein G6M88_23420 [Agrobacterium rubi]